MSDLTDYERVAALHEDYPTFVSWQFATTTILPCSVATILGVTVIYLISYTFIIRRVLPTSSTTKTIRNASYQLTNLSINALIGLTGLYYYTYKVPLDATLEQRVVDMEELYPVTCMQLGYQLWALPFGIIWIQESIPMLGHHVAVISVAIMSAFMTMGFRFFTPLMFGMMELSSVPLALMNAFKDNPHLLKQYPTTNFAIRITFCTSFLFIRWYMVFPPMLQFLRLLGYATWSQPNIHLRIYLMLVWTLAHFLALLQILWGCLIIKGIVRAVTLKSGGKEKKKLT